MREADAIRHRAPVKAAGLAQLAVAIAILSVFPVRLGNLGTIRIGENGNERTKPEFIMPSRGRSGAGCE
jgi:hypothetical protein